MSQINKKISFIVPIYNVERYLDKTIQSILNQQYSNIEIILVNDGSSDRSGEICEKYKDIDSRIKYFSQKNQGVSAARNVGIEQATGDWICFVDGDDFIEEDLCTCLIPCLADDNDICFFSYNDFIRDEKKSHCTAEKVKPVFDRDDFEKMQLSIFFMQGFKYTNPAAIWGKLFNTDFIKKNKLYFKEKQAKSQDTLFMLYALEYAQKGVYYNNNLYNYRIVRESISRRYNPDIFNVYKKLLGQFKIFIMNYKENNEVFIRAYEYRVFRNFMVATTLDCCHADNAQQYTKRREKFLEELNSEPFSSAIKKVKIKMYPIKERILAGAIKLKMFMVINCLTKLRYIVRRMG